MKRLAMAFFGIALLLSNLAAYAASATFATRRGEIFQLFLNGRLVNGPGSGTVRIDRLPAGPHQVEFRVPARRGALVYSTRVFLERGFETNYILILPGYNPNFMLKKVSKVLQRPIGCATDPDPYYGHGNAYDGYDDYESDNSPGYGNGHNQQNQPYGNNGNYNNAPANPYPPVMSRYDVDLLAESIRKRSFDSSKLDIAEQALENATIMAEDVKRLMPLFSFESSRLEFAKFAYSRVADPQNFYRVYDAFEFESSITELQRWLKK